MKKFLKLMAFIMVLTFSIGTIALADDTKYESIEGPDIDLDDDESVDIGGENEGVNEETTIIEKLSPQMIMTIVVAVTGIIVSIITFFLKGRR